jgi:Protein of unknown function (DUF1553)/Protein of unknown function (DUF1549)/Planctomycete cytochrome C/PA14 domain
MNQSTTVFVFLISFLLCIPEAFAQESEVSFSQEIQPLLARRCFACHGPDKAEGGLRLDNREAALTSLDSGEKAIVPNHPEQSELVKRIFSADDDSRMPPEGKPLSEREQALLANWITEGAKWKKHWAFEEVAVPSIPRNTNSPNPVDAFIDDSLSKHDLQRAPQADSLALLRRLYFDLTGLPPTIEEVAAFRKRADADFEKAWASEIDRLLESEQYGERWARHWLDVVRYAETNSFERDGAKPNVWRYRDYVIRAFNSDKPYDQFLTEQLAGDELPQVTRDSLIATGFYRLGIWDDEPADRELALYEGFDDILTTVGQGMLGLTLNCCRCHDHKIDPIPTADYYSSLAFFRNITSNGYGPQIERPLIATEVDRQQYKAAEASLRAEADRIQQKLSIVEQSLKDQLAAATQSQAATSDFDDLEYRFYRDSFDKLPNFDELKPETVAKLVPPLIDIGVATRSDFFGFVFTANLIVPQAGEYTFELDSDDGSRLTLDGRTLVEYDGIHGVGSPKSAKLELKQGRYLFRLDYFQRQYGKGLKLSWSGPTFKNRQLTTESSERFQDLNQAIQSAAVSSLDVNLVAEYKSLRERLEENKQRKPWNEYGMCVSENGTSAPDTFILTRGSPQGKADRVEPGFISVLGGGKPKVDPNAAANTTGRRLALAQWITAPENRLTSRVIVNRIWQHHFGRGIVRSPNNFGLLGETPTHPELLDWLANNFVTNGWRIKPLHKLLLMSQAYRQSSHASEEALSKDPSNNRFSRFDMRRLSAEEIRDAVLAVNGRLNLKMYGPSVYPQLSSEVLASQSVPGSGWNNADPEGQTRRSIYIHIKRSLLVPMLSNFDFPEPDSSCEARFITTQPGQALGMLNGDFLNEQAVEFAKRLKNEAGDKLPDQVALAFRIAFAREANSSEVDRCAQLVAGLKSKHQLSDEQALAYIGLFIFNLNEFIYID